MNPQQTLRERIKDIILATRNEISEFIDIRRPIIDYPEAVNSLVDIVDQESLRRSVSDRRELLRHLWCLDAIGKSLYDTELAKLKTLEGQDE